MTWRVCLGLVGCVLSSSTGATWASGPFDAARVDASASWVMHADMERARGVPMARAPFVQLEPVAHARRQFEALLGLDPAEAVLEFTMYGLADATESARGGASGTITVVRVGDAVGPLRERLERRGTPTAMDGRIVEVSVEGTPWFAAVRSSDEGATAVMVVGASASDVVRALEVLDRGRASLDRAAGPWQRVTPAPGSLVLMALVPGRGMPRASAEDSRSELIRRASAIRIEACDDTEAAGGLLLHAMLDHAEAADAQKSAEVLRGVIEAMASQVEEVDGLGGLAEAIRAASVKIDGTNVEVVARAPFGIVDRWVGAVVSSSGAARKASVAGGTETRPAAESAGPR